MLNFAIMCAFVYFGAKGIKASVGRCTCIKDHVINRVFRRPTYNHQDTVYRGYADNENMKRAKVIERKPR